MPDWLLIYFPLMLFAILFPILLIYNVRQARKKRGRDAQRERDSA